MQKRIERIEKLISRETYIFSFDKTEDFFNDVKESITDRDVHSLYDLAIDVFNSSFSTYKYLYGIGCEDENLEKLRLEIISAIKEIEGEDGEFFKKIFPKDEIEECFKDEFSKFISNLK